MEETVGAARRRFWPSQAWRGSPSARRSPIADTPAPLPHIPIDEPTIAMTFTINTSPFSGREGTYVTSRNLRDRLDKELLTNVSIRVEEAGGPDAFKVMGRGELQLAILIEMMRREGYELMVGKPEILTRRREWKPAGAAWKLLVIDCPEQFIGVVMEKLGERKGKMIRMVNHGSGRVRIEFLRSFARVDRPAQRDAHRYARHGRDEHAIPWLSSSGRAIFPRGPRGRSWPTVAGRATGYAIFNLQERGEMFVSPGTEVYEGMIVGENARDADIDVNIVKEKKLTNMRASTADEAIRLVPPRLLNLEQAIEFIRDDEYVEVTPQSIRLRKKILKFNER